MLRHHSLISMAMGAAQMNDFSGLDVSLNWMPLDVGTFVFLHFMCVYLGCQQIQVPKDAVLQHPLKRRRDEPG